jgi:hypothetical protein
LGQKSSGAKTSGNVANGTASGATTVTRTMTGSGGAGAGSGGGSITIERTQVSFCTIILFAAIELVTILLKIIV